MNVTKKMCVALIGLTFFAGNAFGAQMNVHTPPTCYADIEKLPIHIVRVKAVNGDEVVVGRGTVWLASKNFWVTAAHVVNFGEGVTNIVIYAKDDLLLAAHIVYIDKDRDVAILSAESGDATPINTTNILKPHEPLWNVGYPGAAGETLVSYMGSLFGFNLEGDIVSGILAMPGMSGGPQFRCDGTRLAAVGVITHFITGDRSEGTYTRKDGTKGTKLIIINSGASGSTPIVYVFKAMFEARDK